MIFSVSSQFSFAIKDIAGTIDKFEEALLEIPAVRKDLGYPPPVTPLSQMVDNQAVVNVITGQKYSHISTEVKNCFKGEYGISPAPVSQELRAKIIIGVSAGQHIKAGDCWSFWRP